MKFRHKTKVLLLALIFFVLSLGGLLTATFVIRNGALTEIYHSYIIKSVISNLTVTDKNGTAIYNGKFHSDRSVRKACFHILGDLNGSLPSSVLAQAAAFTPQTNIWTGYDPKAQTMELTIDLPLQMEAYRLLTNGGYNGCVIVTDYRTGDLLAMVSTPSVEVLGGETAENEAYLNKAAYTYTPGSIYKSVTVAAILESGADTSDFSYLCTGSDGDIKCLGVHGQVNLSSALYKSCNCAIAKAAKQYLSPEKLNEFAQKCHILDRDLVLGITLQSGQTDAFDHFGWTASGQSKDLLSPLAATAYYCAIANGGMMPYLSYYSDFEQNERRIFSEKTADFIKDSLTIGMEQWYYSPLGVKSFGKTGTAELDGQNSHAWFICCITQKDLPTYAITVFLKNGGNSVSARKLAAELTKKIVNG